MPTPDLTSTIAPPPGLRAPWAARPELVAYCCWMLCLTIVQVAS